MGIIQLELRLHKLIYSTAQRDVGITKHIRIDRLHHANGLEALAFELLIGGERVAISRLSPTMLAYRQTASM